jgi:hypothetical protein
VLPAKRFEHRILGHGEVPVDVQIGLHQRDSAIYSRLRCDARVGERASRSR